MLIYYFNLFLNFITCQFCYSSMIECANIVSDCTESGGQGNAQKTFKVFNNNMYNYLDYQWNYFPNE